MGVKKTVGRAVLVALGGRVVDVGSGVRDGTGVHVAGELAVMSIVGFGVGVLSSATAVGSVFFPLNSAKDGDINTTVK